MYKVIFPFADTTDKYHVYHEGDTYPRRGIEPSEARIKALSSKNNAMDRPLIKKVSKEEK